MGKENLRHKLRYIPFKLRKKIFEKYHHRCCHCGCKVRLFARYLGDPYTGEIDHIFPHSRGGKDVDSNLQLLCLICNRRKYTKTINGISPNS